LRVSRFPSFRCLRRRVKFAMYGLLESYERQLDIYKRLVEGKDKVITNLENQIQLKDRAIQRLTDVVESLTAKLNSACDLGAKMIKNRNNYW
jgi:predicted DNA-binding protein YlxM (UPF0122 family)